MLDTMIDNRRKDNRVSTRLPLSWRPVDHPDQILRGVTRDISPSGAFFVVECGELEVGDQLELDMTVPPGDGHCSFPGRVMGRSRVVRVEPDPLSHRHGVAVEFSDSLELCF